MCKLISHVLIAGTLAVTLVSLATAQTAVTGVGRAATPGEVDDWGFIVGPDGEGLPSGGATASEGRLLYERRCVACHGPTGQEGPDDRLAGGQGSLAGDEPRKTVGSYWPAATTLWDYVNRAMPFNQPGVLSADEVYAAVAYVLYLNGLVEEDELIDAARLPHIEMPNRDGFVSDPRPDISTARTETAWGDPDLQGIWSYATITPLQRPADLVGRELLTEEEVVAQNQDSATRATAERRGELTPERDLGLAYNQFWWDRGNSTGRTSLIVDPPDGRLPALTREARKRQADTRTARSERPYDSWTDRPLQERCMTYQRVPPVPSGYSNTYQIFQVPGYVAILNEMIHDVRVVPLDGRPNVSEGIRQWNGDSRGRWDNDTLVIETANYRDQTTWRGFPGSRALRAVERFTRVDAHTIHYRYTIYDETTYTRPFTVQLPLVSPPGYVIYEYACHEGNYSIANVLAGARAQERSANPATSHESRD